MDQWLIDLDPSIKAAFDSIYDTEEAAKKINPAAAAQMQQEQDKLVQQAQQMAQAKTAADAAQGGAPPRAHLEPANRGGGKTPVVVLDDPINLKMDKAQIKEDLQAVEDSENLIKNSAAQKVRDTHRHLHDLLGQWFRRNAVQTIESMPDGSVDLTPGLVTALVGGMTTVIRPVFPEVAAAMAALSGLEPGGQAGPVGDKKGQAGNSKGAATKLVNRIAEEAEKQVYIGRENAVQVIPPLVQKLEKDFYDKFVQRTDEIVESLAQQLASRWGEYADPGIFNKLQTQLQKILTLKIKQENLNSKVKSGKLSRGAADQELKKSEKDFDRDHPGGQTKPAPHVTVVEKPIVVHGNDDPLVKDSGVRLKMDLERADRVADAVRNAAETKVSATHSNMSKRIDRWVRHDMHDTIGKMSDGPSDRTAGLVTALVGGITAVIGAAFPEVAVAIKGLEIAKRIVPSAMGAVNAGEQMAQNEYVSNRKEDAADLKDRATGFVNELADKAEDKIEDGRKEAVKSIKAVTQKLKEDAFDRFVEEKADVESLASEVASRWGEYADPNILNKLEQQLHKSLLMWIKHAELSVKVDKGKISVDEARAEQAKYKEEIDPHPYTVDTTRPDYGRGADPHEPDRNRH
jgi:hypothetical protein